MSTSSIHSNFISVPPLTRHERRSGNARFRAGRLKRLAVRTFNSKGPAEETGGESGEKEISIREVLDEVRKWSFSPRPSARARGVIDTCAAFQLHLVGDTSI